jgi:endoglucanase
VSFLTKVSFARGRSRTLLVPLVVVAALVGQGCGRTSGSTGAHGLRVSGLRVSGNRLVTGAGRPLVLQGVNRSGTEYACIHGRGIFDGPSDPTSVRAIASWRVNYVRIPINEDCWLGINGVNPRFGGRAYRRAIVRYAALLNRYGIYAEISLIWAAPGRLEAYYQPAAPDEDHSRAVWRSMATTFRNDPNVILAPWGETLADARCFLHGGCKATYGASNLPYLVAGMQQAVDVMRAAGYRGVISIPGLYYANDLSHWLSFEPSDPLHQLVAEAHVYGKNPCASAACLDRTMAPVARRVPLLLGEYGETADASSCGSSETSTILHWAQAHGVGHAAWAWDTWRNCFALIAGYNGLPANAYGRFVRSWYLAH